MKPGELVPWFRRRMLPVVCIGAVVMAVSAPIAYFVQTRAQLMVTTHTYAERIAELVHDAAHARPRLWRYDAGKLAERIDVEGLGWLPAIVVHDAEGADVWLGTHRGGNGATLFWGRAEVCTPPIATVWVGVDRAPLARGTAELAALFAVLALAIGVVGYLVPMRAIATAEQRIAMLLQQLAHTWQEDERRRIARELHDGAGAALTAARLHLGALARQRAGDAARDPALGPALAAVAGHLDDALDEVRRSTTQLLPPSLRELGLAGALTQHCERVAQAAGLDVRCELAPDLPTVDGAVAAACYRIVQEALNNVLRHAEAARAWVRLEARDRHLHLEVSDDGAGGLRDHSGGGLEFIRERARLVGGQVAVSRQPAHGVRVEVTLPIGAQP